MKLYRLTVAALLVALAAWVILGAYDLGRQRAAMADGPVFWRTCSGTVDGRPFGARGEKAQCGTWADRPDDVLVRKP